MNARSLWASAALAMLVIIPASAALSQPGSPSHQREPGEAGTRRGGPGLHQRMPGGPMRGLDLSDAQKEQIAEIRKGGESERTELRKQLARLRTEMRGAMLEDSPDRRKIVSLAQRTGDVRTKLGVHRTEQMLAIREVLTPEQRDRWLLRAERMRGMDGMRGGWGRMHGGRGGMGARGRAAPPPPEPDGDGI